MENGAFRERNSERIRFRAAGLDRGRSEKSKRQPPLASEPRVTGCHHADAIVARRLGIGSEFGRGFLLIGD